MKDRSNVLIVGTALNTATIRFRSIAHSSGFLFTAGELAERQTIIHFAHQAHS
jgi:hypothetical protein